MLYALLILAEILFVVYTSSRLFKKDTFCGIIYICLFYFALTFEMAYLYFPEQSMANKYVVTGFWDGEAKYWMQCFVFLFLSLASYYICTMFFLKRWKPLVLISITKQEKCGKVMQTNILFANCAILIFTCIDVILFLINYDQLSYQNSLSITSGVYAIMRRVVTGSTYYLCALLAMFLGRQEIRANRLIKICCLICVAIFVVYSFKTGDKSGLATIVFGLGSVFLFGGGKKVSKKTLIGGAIILAIFYTIITISAGLIREQELTVSTLKELLFPYSFQQNMYNMFAVIKYNYVDPIEVIVATVSHFFPKVSHPYLFETVASLFATFTVSGKYSFGHYLFTDGYVFMGPWGFLYNGIVVAYFSTLWARLSKTNSLQYNNVIMALSCSLAFGFVRGSGMGNFIKYLYLYFLPTTLLYIAFTGDRFQLLCRKKGTR